MSKLKRIKGLVKKVTGKLGGKTKGPPSRIWPSVIFQAPAIPGAEGRKFRVACIGLGAQGLGMIKGASALQEVEIVAVADRKSESLAAFAEKLNFPAAKIYSDALELFRQEKDLDLVIIATNSPSHVFLTDLALKAGVRSVCVEKPLGIQLAALKDKMRESQWASAKIGVNFTRRWSADFRAIKSFLASKKIGKPRAAYITLSKGGLAGKAVHMIDLLRFLFEAEVSEVAASLDAGSGHSARGAEYFDPSGNLFLRFSNGARAFVDVSEDISFDDRLIIIKTTTGRVEINEREMRWSIISADGRQDITMVDRPNGTMQVLRSRVIANMLSDDPSAANLADGAAALEGLIAAHLSAQRGGAFVKLPLSEKEAETTVNFP